MKQSRFRYFETNRPLLPVNQRIHVEVHADTYTLEELERLVSQLQEYGRRVELLETPSQGATQ